MKTLNDEWLEFLHRVYPQGAQPEQERQLKAAFYAGATSSLCMVSESAMTSPDVVEAHLTALFNEAQQFAAQYAVERYLRGYHPSRNPGPHKGERN